MVFELQIYSNTLADWYDVQSGDSTFTTYVISMDDLTGDYGYVFRELVLARVTCTNEYGYAADFSTPNTEGALIRQLPAAMGSIYVNAFETNPYQITVYWFELATEALKGDSEILSYGLEISTD